MEPGKLLVLDDDATVGHLIVAVARTAKFDARLCEAPEPFFEAVAGWLPTHLSIDLAMPELDGIGVLRRLAATGCTARIIIASGAGQAELDAALDEARRLGLPTAGVLGKPFSLAQLRGLLAG